jgi:chemotaxis protein CheZ
MSSEPTLNDAAAEAAAAENEAQAAVANLVGGDEAAERIINRIGQLTRTLRESMRELGLDKQVEKAAVAIPDARDRLKYVASMTEQAAERALNSIEIAKPLQEQLQKDAQALDKRWQQWFDEPVGIDLARDIVKDTRTYLKELPSVTQATNTQLMEIMLAQDFQDLTGQVIKKIMEVVYNIEQQLLAVLLENISAERRAEIQAVVIGTPHSGETLLNGPQVNPELHNDVVSDQEQVDDLLTSLGF